MTFYEPTRNPLLINRRRLMGFLAGAVAAGIVTRSEALAYLQDSSAKTGVTAEEWNPETIKALAGTREVDTEADLHALVPESTEGTIQYWNVGPTEPDPQITKDLYQEFQDTFARYYPNITLDNQNIGYNDMLDKIRTAAAGGAAPDVAKMPILWGVEFAARGDTSEVTLEEFGWTAEQFWPGALKSVTWDGKLYGVPTNNETMAFIWNKQIFADAGLDPEITAGDLGRRGRLLESDQAGDWQERLRHGGQGQRRKYAVPLHAACGPSAAARSTKPSTSRPTRPR